MTLYKNKYRIESARRPGFDYSTPGYYFFTTVTKNRENLFGEIVDHQMILNESGEIVSKCWYEIPDHVTDVKIDEFVVMPNHVHGIIQILGRLEYIAPVRTQHDSSVHDKIGKLSIAIRSFKSATTKKINENQYSPGQKIWQPRFHDRIIRSEKELNNIRKYISENPKSWMSDKENLNGLGVSEKIFKYKEAS